MVPPRLGLSLFVNLCWLFLCLSYLQTIHANLLPPLVPAVHSFTPSGQNDTFHLAPTFRIVVDASKASSRSTNDTTLIPPTLREFAETFLSDIQEIFSLSAAIEEIAISPDFVPKHDDIILTLLPSAAAQNYVLAKGTFTEEGYEMVVTSSFVKIMGSGPKGVFWGTRTLLQGLILTSKSFPTGIIKDQPDWETRGFMLDVARKFYPIEYLTEMCAYASFFKTSQFHVHLSDNLSPNGDFNTYARFRLRSEFEGLTPHVNETYSREEFDNFQQSCALRGVTVIPELEAPGHALVINQWKPELALSTDFTLLNLSYPETLPTVKTIWQEFLPWMHSKQVSIGADEYDANLADDYNNYVDTMDEFIGQYGKTIRIWGTNEPSNRTSVNKNVIIQHWEFFEDDPFELIQEGYRVINSDDAFNYIVIKFSESYPQMLNETRLWDGANTDTGGIWYPAIFDRGNASNNPLLNDSRLEGSIMALWNDNGPTASTPLEAFYGFKRGLPITVSAGWQAASRPNHLTEQAFNTGFPVLQASIPGQNLDRNVKSKTPLIAAYDLTNASGSIGLEIEDKSGNGYEGRVVEKGIMDTPLRSKGLNYTFLLQLRVTKSYLREGNILTGPDDTFGIVQSGSGFTFAFNSTNITYPLQNYTLPSVTEIDEGNTPSLKVVIIATEKGTSAYIDGSFVGSFMVAIPAAPMPVHMSFVAPLQTVRYDLTDFGLVVEKFMVWDGVNKEASIFDRAQA